MTDRMGARHPEAPIPSRRGPEAGELRVCDGPGPAWRERRACARQFPE